MQYTYSRSVSQRRISFRNEVVSNVCLEMAASRLALHNQPSCLCEACPAANLLEISPSIPPNDANSGHVWDIVMAVRLLAWCPYVGPAYLYRPVSAQLHLSSQIKIRFAHLC